MENKLISLEDYIKKVHPSIVKEHERFNTPFEKLTISTKLVSLRAGFSGPAGMPLEVTSEIRTCGNGERYVEVTNIRNKNICILKESTWFYSVEIVKD
jgi:hypothetical protein